MSCATGSTAGWWLTPPGVGAPITCRSVSSPAVAPDAAAAVASATPAEAEAVRLVFMSVRQSGPAPRWRAGAPAALL